MKDKDDFIYLSCLSVSEPDPCVTFTLCKKVFVKNEKPLRQGLRFGLNCVVDTTNHPKDAF